jgi:hypothetical protein
MVETFLGVVGLAGMGILIAIFVLELVLAILNRTGLIERWQWDRFARKYGLEYEQTSYRAPVSMHGTYRGHALNFQLQRTNKDYGIFGRTDPGAVMVQVQLRTPSPFTFAIYTKPVPMEIRRITDLKRDLSAETLMAALSQQAPGLMRLLLNEPPLLEKLLKFRQIGGNLILSRDLLQFELVALQIMSTSGDMKRAMDMLSDLADLIEQVA